MSRCKIKIITMMLLVFSLLPAEPAKAQALKANEKGSATSAANVTGSDSRAAASTGATDVDYIIGPDDVLAVNVWKEPDISRSVPVRPDGKITLPLVGDIQAYGATPIKLQAAIEKSLSEYISKPVVTVIVQEARSHKFNIIGEVHKPGTYVLSSPMTVLDAIALAGGFREWAKVKSIYVLRESSPGGPQRIPFNYKDVVKGNSSDVQLKVKDTIVVP